MKLKPKDRKGAQDFRAHPSQLQHVCTTQPLRCWRSGLRALTEKLEAAKLLQITSCGCTGVWTVVGSRAGPRVDKGSTGLLGRPLLGHGPAGSSQLQPSHRFSELPNSLPLNSMYAWIHQKLFQSFSTKKTIRVGWLYLLWLSALDKAVKAVIAHPGF